MMVMTLMTMNRWMRRQGNNRNEGRRDGGILDREREMQSNSPLRRLPPHIARMPWSPPRLHAPCQSHWGSRGRHSISLPPFQEARSRGRSRQQPAQGAGKVVSASGSREVYERGGVHRIIISPAPQRRLLAPLRRSPSQALLPSSCSTY